MLENEIKSSPIEEIHSLNDAKFVNFAGWSMPIQFPNGIINEHISTRSSCGLFDISHMGQILIDGDESRLLLEKITGLIIEITPTMKSILAIFEPMILPNAIPKLSTTLKA